MTSIPAPTVDPAVRSALRKGAGRWIASLYRHEVLVARTVRGMQLEAARQWGRTVVDPLLRTIAGRLATFDERGAQVAFDLFPQLQALEQDIRRTVASGTEAVRVLTTERLHELVANEARWVAESAKKVLRVDAARPTDAQVMAAVDQRPFLGQRVEGWFQETLAKPTGDRARRLIEVGLQRGWTTDQITKGLRGSPKTGGSDGVLSGESVRTVQTIVRTAATHASAQTRLESFKALGVATWRFVATLDSKTSLQCASLDGKTFPLGQGPVPPLHPNCRSTAVPNFGDPSEPMGERASVDGPVPADLAFPEWLEGQSVAVQNEVLGKTKADAWRAGEITIQQMLGRDLQPLTIAELRALDILPNPEDEGG